MEKWYKFGYKYRFIFTGVFLAIAFLGLSIYLFWWRAPANFPIASLYTVEFGTGLNSLASDLKNKEIIRSPFFFKTVSVILGGFKGILAGDYILDKKQGTVALAWRLARGEFDLSPVRITVPEGYNVKEISNLVSQKFFKVSEEEFIEIASSAEGYLFPDTYLFLPNVKSDYIVREMRRNFQTKIKSLSTEIAAFGKTEAEIIKMASIVEEEARTMETRQIIAGILWKRLAKGMPLQVDVSFKYINGKTTKNLTNEDLKIDSPYNSYLYKGLPPTPICNPGLEAIKATLTPIKTDYLYFLSDRSGVMHYAKTYQGHLQNKEMYLK